MFGLKGQVSLVTGAGRGIGRQVCLTLANAGSDVVCLDVDYKAAKGTASIVKRAGRKGIALKADVSNEEDMERISELISKKFGNLHILVNNAGITGTVVTFLKPDLAGFEKIDVEEWDRIMNVNLKGTFLITKTLVQFMKKQNYGRIVNISSRLGKTGGELIDGAHYAASKAAIINFTKTVAKELAPYRITVNAVAPSMVEGTAMTDWLDERLKKEFIKSIPVGRLCTVNDVAYAVLFLCSREAEFITGHTLDVNGGLLMD